MRDLCPYIVVYLVFAKIYRFSYRFTFELVACMREGDMNSLSEIAAHILFFPL